MRVGFVGLGDIGMPMAQRLIEQGFSVIALDTDGAKSAALASSGAEVAEAAADLYDCDVVGLAVPDDSAVEEILLANGLLDGLAEGSVVLIHSTILPETARRLAEQGARRGVTVSDAPVSGGAARARQGDLAVMLGGDPQVMTTAGKVLDALASNAVHLGPSGAGAATKLANQLAMLAALAALHEGLSLAEHYGAEEKTVLQVLGYGTGSSWVGQNWGFFDDLVRTYNATGVPLKNRPWSKDLWDVVASARAAELRVPLAGVLSQVLPDAVEQHSSPEAKGK
ncbi:beta-hydroxyacid dehydrogenase, 3-hydroxyisobutyrate dehydrogenase [Pseudarthrobacter phenanthrenivorans Sphe3]|uniref:Beta-hydroxyacid dehydrogenase, 3-hydroxyisobutyrate dehydrogenase n=2 Tax=Pseudarthrobacter phenanthrenivorans TaxID=361575 RepID=F0M4L5_PSEPM|nr:beta-hydroxyacid dehydrogenase, 3-hydroxyisobutyrate dehydrogenase [Pseudarthrobacter phenanthrenivorans Sphe3]